MNRMNEKQQIEALKNGSYKAFEVLYDEYYHLLYGYVFGLIRSHEDTREIVQNTFIKIWLHRAKLDMELSFKAWLFKIAKNSLLNDVRKKWNDPLFEDYMLHCEDAELTEDNSEFDFELFRIALVKAKVKLTPRQKEVFELSKEENYTPSEIAVKLHITEDSVYNYLSAAIAVLRKEMKDLSFALLFFVFFC
jgi:RNA polymerase sigma-70 factor (ECF subfamily)